MRRLSIIEGNLITKKITLHKNILDILFSHKKEILNKLSDIKGLYRLDHIAIIIFNPINEIVIFSITPSVEYNIIVQNLWRQDIAFNPHQDGTFLWWDQNPSIQYDEIKKYKEINHNFTNGFNLYRTFENFKFVYSFAFRNKDKNARIYYESIKEKLFLLGDYSYKLIRHIYLDYCPNYEAPTIISNNFKHHQSYLKLIVDNKIL